MLKSACVHVHAKKTPKSSQAELPDTVCSTYAVLWVRFVILNLLTLSRDIFVENKQTMLHCCEQGTQPAVEHGI